MAILLSEGLFQDHAGAVSNGLQHGALLSVVEGLALANTEGVGFIAVLASGVTVHGDVDGLSVLAALEAVISNGRVFALDAVATGHSHGLLLGSSAVGLGITNNGSANIIFAGLEAAEEDRRDVVHWGIHGVAAAGWDVGPGVDGSSTAVASLGVLFDSDNFVALRVWALSPWTISPVVWTISPVVGALRPGAVGPWLFGPGQGSSSHNGENHKL